MFTIQIRSLAILLTLISLTSLKASDPSLPTLLLSPIGILDIDAPDLDSAIEQFKQQAPALEQTTFEVQSRGQKRHMRPVKLCLKNVPAREALKYIGDLAGYRIRIIDSKVVFDVVDWVGRPPTFTVYLPNDARIKLRLGENYTQTQLSAALEAAGLPYSVMETFPARNRFSICDSKETILKLSNALALLATTNLTTPKPE